MGEKAPLVKNTLLLVAVATALLHVSLVERQSAPWLSAAQLVVSLVLGGMLLRFAPADQHGATPKAALVPIAFVALPLLWDLVCRSAAGLGDPYEVQLAFALRNAMFVAVAVRQERATRAAALASLFVVLFSFLWGMTPLSITLLVAYALLGMWWLMADHWERLEGRFAEESSRSIPRGAGLLACLLPLVILVAAAPLASRSDWTTALAGFFPSSGGVDGRDDQAIGGVGDGDQLVSAKENASSFGPVESELFLESHMPSLYDAVNEFSNAIPPKTKRTRRAIPLGVAKQQEEHTNRSVAQQVLREFQAVRQRRTNPPKTRDLRSHALLLIKGRVPVHLGMHAYDTWDGASLTLQNPTPAAALELAPADRAGDRWARIQRDLPVSMFPYTERHQVRVVNLKTDRVPTPPNATAVTTEKLHVASMFHESVDGALAMDLDTIPQLTILDVQSRRITRASEPTPLVGEESSRNSRIAALAQAWTEGLPNGWDRVREVCRRLRSDYQLDTVSTGNSSKQTGHHNPADHDDDAVERFLFDERRGPDYLFATSAASMLRSLGFATRVRSGLYARAENYDRRTQLTAVYKDDVHFWVEVLVTQGTYTDTRGDVATGSWITIEPSPGYEVLYAPESWLAWFVRLAGEAAEAVARRPIGVGAAVLVGLIAYACRIALLDGIATLWWLASLTWLDTRGRVLSTVRLLERRGRLRGAPRQRGATLSDWLASAGTQVAAEGDRDFLHAATWALYAEGLPPTLPTPRIQAACRTAAWRLRRGARRAAA
jgi:transglutaminase-like putative cysteine protease